MAGRDLSHEGGSPVRKRGALLWPRKDCLKGALYVMRHVKALRVTNNDLSCLRSKCANDSARKKYYQLTVWRLDLHLTS